jgi:hypothetical protein
MLFTVHAQSSNQNHSFALLFFVEHIFVATPGGCKRFRARAVKELLQDFLPTELAHYVFIEL